MTAEAGARPHDLYPRSIRPVVHGTLYAYQARGCRCADCRLANTEYHRARLGRRSRAEFAASRRGRTHGLRSTYTHGCRCADCREAERLYRAERRGRAS